MSLANPTPERRTHKRRKRRAPDRVTEFLDAVEHEAAQAARQRVRYHYLRCEAHCESAIERLMLIGFIRCARTAQDHNMRIVITKPHANWSDLGHLNQQLDGAMRVMAADVGVTRMAWIMPQAVVGDYRLDFHIRCARQLPERSTPHHVDLAVECDGQDFHGTVEQTHADRERDRFLTAHGFTVLRFTGTELWRDPAGCAQTVFDRITRFFNGGER